jgi:hypothetical protein
MEIDIVGTIASNIISANLRRKEYEKIDNVEHYYTRRLF